MRSFRNYARGIRRLELSLLRWLRHDPIGRRLAYPFRHIVSNAPTRDISLFTWVAFVYGIQVSGFHFAAACILNMGCVMLLRSVIRAKRPVEYDPGLRQLADRGRGNYGFPSVETHMAIVVYGQLVVSRKESSAVFLMPLAVTMCLIVGMSRLVAASRFPHQIVLSYATGALGLVYAQRAVNSLPPWRKSWHNIASNRPHFIFVLVATLFVAAFLAHAAEDNSSHVLSIPNSEFTRVLRSVYASSASPRPRSMDRVSRATAQYTPPDSLAILSSQLSARKLLFSPSQDATI